MISGFSEIRILVFFIYFELFNLLLILILIMKGLKYLSGWANYLTLSLFIIGTSGAETAVFLVLFITYFRITGLTTFDKYTARNFMFGRNYSSYIIK